MSFELHAGHERVDEVLVLEQNSLLGVNDKRELSRRNIGQARNIFSRAVSISMVGTGADFIDAPVAKKYEMLMRIGRGLYGVVWKANAQEETAQKQVAIKRMFNAFSNKIDAKRTYREIMYLLNFTGHQNIVMLYDVLAGDTDMDMYLVTECMDTDLSSIIQSMYSSR